MRGRRTLPVFLAVALFVICGIAFAATSYPDRVGDVKGGAGPDLASITLSSTKTTVTFRVRFAAAPPLRAGKRWVDMLLIGVDVPPLGPGPRSPGGEWRGANFALGTHGPATTGLMVQLRQGKSRPVTRFRIRTSGSTLSFSIPRRALGDPAWFAFSVAAARESVSEEAAGGGVDTAPAQGTFRYTLTAGA